MKYKKGIAFLMISTTVLEVIRMHTISDFAEETTNLVEKSVAM